MTRNFPFKNHINFYNEAEHLLYNRIFVINITGLIFVLYFLYSCIGSVFTVILHGMTV